VVSISVLQKKNAKTIDRSCQKAHENRVSPEQSHFNLNSFW